MAKRKQRARNVRRVAAAGQAKAASEPAPEDQISYSALSLHALFEQQTRQVPDRAALEGERRQNFLAAMSSPCGGAGAMSSPAKLKRKNPRPRRRRREIRGRCSAPTFMGYALRRLRVRGAAIAGSTRRAQLFRCRRIDLEGLRIEHDAVKLRRGLHRHTALTHVVANLFDRP